MRSRSACMRSKHKSPIRTTPLPETDKMASSLLFRRFAVQSRKGFYSAASGNPFLRANSGNLSLLSTRTMTTSSVPAQAEAAVATATAESSGAANMPEYVLTQADKVLNWARKGSLW